jgi:Family of unknown function (DUF7019)
MPPLRYFVYVSDAKLEQLFQQINVIDPKLLERLSIETKVDLKVASLAIKTAPDPASTRMAQLIVVERYIDAHQRVGTVREPGTRYFRGTMPMRWGWLSDFRSRPSRSERAIHEAVHGGNAAFFRGEHDGQIVVLVGSRRHVLGERPLATNTVVDDSSYSILPTVMPLVADHVNDLYDKAQFYNDERRRLADECGASIEDPPPEHGLEACATLRLHGPPQWMEFLAVPLVEGDIPVPEHADANIPKGHAILATPIYIAHADPA